MTAATVRLPSLGDRSPVSRILRRYLARASLTLLAVMLLSAFLLPLLFMVTTSLQQGGQRSIPGAPVYPAVPATGTYQGQTLPHLHGAHRWGQQDPDACRERPRAEHFHRPGRPDADADRGTGRWRTLSQSWTFAPQWDNYSTVWSQLNFPRLLFNTAAIAVLSTIGAVVSSALVAYGFARFRFPGKNILFVILIATIILPFQVTLIPTYVIFTKLGWNGTWLPLIIPHFFANAFNVFLLRQYFMSIPRDLDEAAMIDGAGPVPDPSLGHPAAVDPGHHGGQLCSTSSSRGTTSSCRCCTCPASRSCRRCRSRSSSTTRCT